MKRCLMLAGLLGFCFVTVGCIDATTLVTVKKDGSGMIVETVFLGKAIQEMMKGMAGAVEGGGNISVAGSTINEQEYKTKAGKMGEGVVFVSARELSRKDGSKGVQAVYTFKDIRKVQLNSEPEAPGGGMGGGQQAGKKKKLMTFGFVAGDTAKLIIDLPQPEKKANDEARPENNEPVPEPAPEQLAMMRQMFDGFRFRMMIKVDGEIEKTNAKFVQVGNESKQQQYVTLADMDLGKLLGDEESLKKLASQASGPDMGEALKGLDLPGIKVETAPRVEIEFR